MIEAIGERLNKSKFLQRTVELITGKLDEEGVEILYELTSIQEGIITDPEQIKEIMERSKNFRAEACDL